MNQIEKLKDELKDKVKINQEVQQEYEIMNQNSRKDHELLLQKVNIIQTLKRQNKQQESMIKKLEQKASNLGTSSAGINDETIINGNDEDGGAPLKALNEEEGDGISDNDENEDFKSEEDELYEREYETNSVLARKELLLVDGTLNEKEELLRSITENQLILERNLVDEMKQQYHQQILQLENELKGLEKKRDQALSKIQSSAQHENERNKIIVNYKQKLTDLESKLGEFRKKEKGQDNLAKLVNNQKQKITQLDDEIKKIKSQKVQLHKKMREEHEQYEKWK